jgi:hypothetical protein
MVQSASDNLCLPAATQETAEWYYLQDGEHRGALTATELVLAAKRGEIKHDTLVWQKEFVEWVEAAFVPSLAEVLGKPSGEVAKGSPSSRADQVHALRADTPRALPLIVEAEQAAADEVSGEELHDALSDEEAEEPSLDEEQIRILLERTSYLPRERSIPPAIGGSIVPPAQIERIGLARKPTARSMAIVSSLVLAMGLALIVRASRTNRDLQQEERSSAANAPSLNNAKVTASKDVTTVKSSGSERAGVKNSPTPIGSIVHEAAARGDAWLEQGALDLTLLTRKVERARPVFDEQCWSKYQVPYVEVPPNPSILVTVIVDRRGKVYDIESTKAPPGYQGAGLCIIGRMRGWQFPPSEENSKAVVRVSRLPGTEAKE